MREIDVPNQPVHGVRALATHMLTVALGLLMALALEKIVEWRHHLHLAHQAETAMLEELRENAYWVHATRRAVPNEQKWAESVLAALDAPSPAPNKELVENFFANFNLLPATRWELAKTTNALAYIDENRAALFSVAYSVQATLSENQTEAFRAHTAVHAIFPQLTKLARGERLSAGESDRVRDAVLHYLANVTNVDEVAGQLQAKGYAPILGHEDATSPPVPVRSKHDSPVAASPPTPQCREGGWLGRKLCAVVRKHGAATASASIGGPAR